MTDQARGRVFIIGAGPGDPGLITVRGARMLSEADVVIYDRAVEGVLRWSRPDAERLVAGAAAERDMAQDAISMLIAEKARDGLVVARLKWGDPFVFDSGAKEALFLHEQRIPFEVIPGVPVAIGGTAYAGIPATYPGAGDSFVLVRGQEDEQDELPDIDWSSIAALEGTFACYAGGRSVPLLLQRLLDHGMPGDTPAALVYQGTQPQQRTVTGTLAELHQTVAGAPAGSAALVVAGSVVGLRDHLRWFDERPLFGRRIVVTRSQEQAGELIDALENLGGEPILAPTFRVTAPDDPEALDRAVASVAEYGWVVFESASAVTRFLGALARGPRDLRVLGTVHICAIGASTAERLIAAGLKPDVALIEAGTESVADLMHAHDEVASRRILIVRPDHVRDSLASDLERRGASVTDVVAYRSEAASADSSAAQELYRRLLDKQIDAVTFTSPTAVRRFASLVGEEQAADLLNGITVATIGPVTAAAAREMGVTNPLVANPYTVQGLTELLVKTLGNAS